MLASWQETQQSYAEPAEETAKDWESVFEKATMPWLPLALVMMLLAAQAA